MASFATIVYVALALARRVPVSFAPLNASAKKESLPIGASMESEQTYAPFTGGQVAASTFSVADADVPAPMTVTASDAVPAGISLAWRAFDAGAASGTRKESVTGARPTACSETACLPAPPPLEHAATTAARAGIA